MSLATGFALVLLIGGIFGLLLMVVYLVQNPIYIDDPVEPMEKHTDD